MNFVSRDLAIKLNEKGFNKLCFGYYHPETPTEFVDGALVLNCDSCNKETPERDIDFQPNVIGAPTIEQVLEWLRKEKKIHLVIDIKRENVYEKNIWGYFVVLLNSYFGCVRHYGFESDSYDGAAIAGIEYVINNLI